MKNPRRLIASLTGIIVAITLAVVAFTHGGQDDTYITYFAAHSLGDHGVIANYSGLRIEQSSSLGLVVVLGLLRALSGLPVPVLGYVVSLAAFAAALWLVSRMSEGLRGWEVFLSVAAVGTIPAFAYWSTSGMETSLVVASGFWLVKCLSAEWPAGNRRASRIAATETFFASLLFASTRPETPLLAGALVVLAELEGSMRRPAPHALSPRLLPSALGIAVLVLFRRLYFGAWVPNPARIKQHGFAWKHGFEYLAKNLSLTGYLPFVLAAIAFVLAVLSLSRTTRAGDGETSESGARALFLSGALGLGYVAFVVLSGGDWMRGGRFVALGSPFAAFSGFLAVRRLGAFSNRYHIALGLTLVGLNLFATYRFLASGEPEGRPLWTARAAVEAARTRVDGHYYAVELANKVHVRDALLADQLAPLVTRIHQHLGRRVTLLSGQAGLVAYETALQNDGKIRFLDQWNITDPALLRCLGKESFAFTIFGTAHNLGTVLDGLERKGKKCGLGGLPDIYFNERLRAPHREALRAHGYVVVYHQTGTVKNSEAHALFESSGVADGHIAVRGDIAAALGLKPRPAYRWNLNPGGSAPRKSAK